MKPTKKILMKPVAQAMAGIRPNRQAYEPRSELKLRRRHANHVREG
jgi:hypothetical protein